jgi:hypothetical protein
MAAERGPTLIAATNFSRYRNRGIIALVGVALTAAAGSALWFHSFCPASILAAPAMRIVPFANLPGHQRNPSFSPDGKMSAGTSYHI